MAAGGSLAGTFGFLVGVGPGAGMALILVVFGLMDTLVGIGPSSVRTVRDTKAILPDFDAAPATAALRRRARRGIGRTSVSPGGADGLGHTFMDVAAAPLSRSIRWFA